MTGKKKYIVNIKKYMTGKKNMTGKIYKRKVDVSPGPGGSPVPQWREVPQSQCPDQPYFVTNIVFRFKHQKCNFGKF